MWHLKAGKTVRGIRNTLVQLSHLAMNLEKVLGNIVEPNVGDMTSAYKRARGLKNPRVRTLDTVSAVHLEPETSTRSSSAVSVSVASESIAARFT